MPKSFDVDTIHGTYTVNPLNVTFIRPQHVKRALHTLECMKDDPFCPLQFPGNAQLPDMYKCSWSDPEEVAEICFVNTVGPQSSVSTTMSTHDVRNFLDEALRYDR